MILEEANMDGVFADRIEAAIGRRPAALAPPACGSTVQVGRVDLSCGDRLRTGGDIYELSRHLGRTSVATIRRSVWLG
jgi:hypothetical protein